MGLDFPFDAAVAESHRTGKAVLLDFNAEWCPPCQRLKRELPDLDILQRRFGIDAFPTLIVYSPATGREQRLQGYAGRENTLDWIQSAAAAVR